MVRLALLLALFAIAANPVWGGRIPNERIVGGEVVEPHSIPFQVLVKFGNYVGCGGSVYDNETIITAAHCCQGQTIQSIKVVAGEHDRQLEEGTEQERELRSKVQHPKYDPFASVVLSYDICLLKLSEPLELNEYVSPVPLPSRGATFAAGSTATVSGWGTLESGGSGYPTQLYSVDVPIVSDVTCQEAYVAYGEVIPEVMLCAGEGGKDSCQGDSGGPLMCEEQSGAGLPPTRVQCGIVSWGIGCGDPQYPGVYTELAYFLDWIEENA